jgi:hypothetical protein
MKTATTNLPTSKNLGTSRGPADATELGYAESYARRNGVSLDEVRFVDFAKNGAHQAVFADHPSATGEIGSWLGHVAFFVVKSCRGVEHHGPWRNEVDAFRYADSVDRFYGEAPSVERVEPYVYVPGFGRAALAKPATWCRNVVPAVLPPSSRCSVHCPDARDAATRLAELDYGSVVDS